jgi:hypothetical protein
MADHEKQKQQGSTMADHEKQKQQGSTMADHEEQKQHDKQQDRFSRLMFGSFPPSRQSNDNPSMQQDGPSPQGPDFMQLFENVDKLVASFDQLKPLMKKITSIVNMLKK